MASPSPSLFKIIAQNRKARHNFFIADTLEAGVILMGSEIKSLRFGKSNIEDSYVTHTDGELYLLNMFISEYASAKHFSHDTKRPRKLLLRKREINKLIAAIRREGMTIVPLSVYFNEKGRIKLKLGLVEGKKKADKRAHEKERDWNRQKGRILRNKNN